jgi:uncharacterized protein involved in exopolysaccharide biosynthesis/Mrp family chromosome partitioning ATPase
MNWTHIDRDIAYRIASDIQPIRNIYNTRYPQGDDEQAASGVYLIQLLDTLRRRRRLILTIALCGTLLATAAALLIPPKYTAGAQIIIEPTLAAGGPSASPTAEDSAIDTHVKLLTSHDHLQRVIQSLLADPEFIAITKRSGRAATAPPAPASPKPSLAETETSWIGELNRRLHIWTGALFRDRHGAPIDLEDLNRHLRVAQEDRSRVIVIRYTSRSPEESAIVVNKTVQLYIDGQNDQKSKYASRELALLRERIADARNTAMQSAAAVQKEARDQSQASQDPNSEKAQDANTRFHALERDAAESALIYSNLRKREREILDQRGDIGSIARIVSLATPPSQPSSHNPILFILPILIILLIGGSFIAVVMEQGDRGLRSERDVKDALGIPCVGFIPRLSDIRNVKPHQHMLTEPFSAYTESIRSVVGELWLTTPQRAPRTVLISSSVPGEGKTTAAVSIAVCAASLGRRVLMIDLDFKRPSVARELGNSTAGEIFDVLLRNQSVADITTHIPDLGIDYLAMPTSPLDALPVLADQRLPVLLRELGKNYDSIIIDGPPILGIVESRLLASMADKVVFVVKWGSTRREVAQNAIGLLRAPNRRADGIDIPIALLTQVDLKMHASYRYGDAGEALVTYENYYSRPNQS